MTKMTKLNYFHFYVKKVNELFVDRNVNVVT